MPRILIVEDDTDINNAICEYLTQKGCACTQAFSGTEGRLYWQQGGLDLVVADLMLPGISGQQLIAQIRRDAALPVIVLSARTALEDKAELFGLGADDYMTKPFSLEELWLRIGVQLRHAGGSGGHGAALTYKDWTINTETRTLTVKGEPVVLTLHEFEIVALLAARPQKVFTRQEIFERVWNEEYLGDSRTVDLHIQRMRKKLGLEDRLTAVYKVGYRLEG